LGFGVTTATPGRIRSGQSCKPFGLPCRTRKTIVLVYGTEPSGSRVCQSFASSPRCASASMSEATASVTTSAGSPSSTARACAPDPPFDVLMPTWRPVWRCQACAKALLNSRYNSRVGS
jgi:hypothetical protein